jgi:aspartyl-tRNA(Asn)/glutamyl-tRNA(Gln) amidotransferase subunit C
MADFNKQELLHIANLSALKLEDHEIDAFVGQINTILTYVDQLKQVQVADQVSQVRNINIFREDEPIKGDAKDVLAQAPQVDDNYFAVPKILDEK